jgi:hypothetical protein
VSKPPASHGTGECEIPASGGVVVWKEEGHNVGQNLFLVQVVWPGTLPQRQALPIAPCDADVQQGFGSLMDTVSAEKERAQEPRLQGFYSADRAVASLHAMVSLYTDVSPVYGTIIAYQGIQLLHSLL